MAVGVPGAVIGSAWIKFYADTQSLITGINKGTASLKQFAAVGASIYAVARAVQATTEQFIAFDRALHNVWTLVNKNRAEIQQLGKDIRAMARHFNVSATEAIRALYQINSATFYGADAMNILRNSIKGAAAGLSDVKDTATMTAAILNAYQMSAKEAAHVNDLLFTTIRYGVTTLPELTSQFGRLAGVAAPAGARLEEMTAAIATLTRQGIRTDWAITSLRQTLMQILRPPQKLKEVIQALGYASGRALIETTGFAKGLRMISEYAQENGIRMEQLFTNVRAVTGVLPLATTAASAYAKDLERMKNSAGTANQAFIKQTESMSYQIAVLRTLIADLAISFGSLFADAIKTAIAVMKTFIGPLRAIVDVFNKLGGGVIIAVASALGVFVMAVKSAKFAWASLQRVLFGGVAAFTEVSSATTMASRNLQQYAMTMTAVEARTAAGFAATRGIGMAFAPASTAKALTKTSILSKLFQNPLMAGVGIMGAASAIQGIIDVNIALNAEVTGAAKVREIIASGIQTAFGAVMGGAVLGQLFGAGAALGGAVGLGLVAGAALTIYIIHEVRSKQEARKATFAEAQKIIEQNIGILPKYIGGNTKDFLTNTLIPYARKLTEMNSEFAKSADAVGVMTDALTKLYASVGTGMLWNQTKGWALSGPAARIAEYQNSPIKFADGMQKTANVLPTVTDSIKSAREEFDKLWRTIHSGGVTLDEAQDAYDRLQKLIDDWVKKSEFAQKTGLFSDKQVQEVKQFADWLQSQITNTTKDALQTALKSITISMAPGDIYTSLSNLLKQFPDKAQDIYKYGADLITTMRNEAAAKRALANGDARLIAEANALENKANALESAFGVLKGAVEIFEQALNDANFVLESFAGQVSAAFSALESAFVSAQTLAKSGAIASALVSGYNTLKSQQEMLERIINGSGYTEEVVKAAINRWKEIQLSLQNAPSPGKTYAELQAEHDKEQQEILNKQKAAASAAKQAAQDAKNAYAEASQRLQDAYNNMFDIPAQYGLTSGDWMGAATAIVSMARNRGHLFDMAKAISDVTGKSISQIDVLNMLSSAQSKLTSALEQQIAIMQWAGEDVTALKKFKQSIEDLFDPLGALNKKIREILNIAIATPYEAGSELRQILLDIISNAPGHQTGGPVPGFGFGDTVPAMLEPGEFVVPNWMMGIPWLRDLIYSIWKRGKRMKEGGMLDIGGGFGMTSDIPSLPGLVSGFSDVGNTPLSSGMSVSNITPSTSVDITAVENIINRVEKSLGSLGGSLSALQQAASYASSSLSAFTTGILSTSKTVSSIAAGTISSVSNISSIGSVSPPQPSVDYTALTHIQTLLDSVNKKTDKILEAAANGTLQFSPGNVTTPTLPTPAPTVKPDDLSKITMPSVKDNAEILNELKKIAHEIAQYNDQVSQYTAKTSDINKQIAQIPTTMQELIQSVLGGKASGNEQKAFAMLIQQAKPGGDVWKALTQAYKDHIASINALIDDYKLLGLSTVDLENQLILFESAVSGLPPILSRLKYWYNAYGNSIKNFIDKLLPGMSSLTDAVYAAFGAFFKADFKGLMRAWDILKNGLAKSGTSISKIADTIIKSSTEFIRSGGLDIITSALTVFSSIIDMIISHQQKQLEELQKQMQLYKQAFSSMISTISGVGNDLANSILGPFSGFIKTFTNAWSEAVNLVFLDGIDLMKAGIEIAMNFISGMASALLEVFKKSQAFMELQQQLDSVWQAVADLFGQLVWPLVAIVYWMKQFLGITEETTKAMQSLNVPSGFKANRLIWQSAAPGVAVSDTNNGNHIPQWALEIGKQFADAIYQIFKDYGIASWEDLLSGARDIAQNVWRWLTARIPDIVASIKEIISNTNSLLDKWGISLGSIGQSLANIVNGIIKNAPEWANGFLSNVHDFVIYIGYIWNWIYKNIPSWDDISGKFNEIISNLNNILDISSLESEISKVSNSINALKRALLYGMMMAAGGIIGAIVGSTILAPAALAGALAGIAGGGILAALLQGIAGFDSGGVVPGAPGAPMLAIVHGGELIIPRNDLNNIPTISGANIPSNGNGIIENKIYLDGNVLYTSMRRINAREEHWQTGTTVGSRAWRAA